MELIPILSLIILVATISTFILAVGAYILYKIRERKGRETAAQPAAVPAELVSPMPMMAEQEASRSVSSRSYAQEPVYAPTRATGPQLRPTYVSQAPDSRYSAPTMEGERYGGQKKFTRYTTERVQESRPVERNKEEKESLRWR